jgi:hypothetical protein
LPDEQLALLMPSLTVFRVAGDWRFPQRGFCSHRGVVGDWDDRLMTIEIKNIYLDLSMAI